MSIHSCVDVLSEKIEKMEVMLTRLESMMMDQVERNEVGESNSYVMPNERDYYKHIFAPTLPRQTAFEKGFNERFESIEINLFNGDSLDIGRVIYVMAGFYARCKLSATPLQKSRFIKYCERILEDRLEAVCVNLVKDELQSVAVKKIIEYGDGNLVSKELIKAITPQL